MKRRAVAEANKFEAAASEGLAFDEANSISLAEAEGILTNLAGIFFPADSVTRQPDDESAIQHKNEALEALDSPDIEARYRTLVEQLPAVVFMAYLDRGIGEAYISPQIEAVLGFTQEEWLNDPVRWYQQIHPEDKARWSIEAAQMFLSGQPLRSVYRVLARDGRVIWFHCEAKMVRRDDGRPWFIHGAAFDITDVKQAEESLRVARDELDMRVQERTRELAAANTELQLEIAERKRAEQERIELLAREQEARRQAEQANRLKDEFLATVSHELRTPLTAVIGWAHLLRVGQLDPASADRALETIERNARSQTRLIEDLLDISRIISGKLRLETREVELTQVIEAAIDAVRPAAQAKQIELQTAFEIKASRVLADPDRLQQAVWNLLSNAIKFTPQGGRVAVRLRREGANAEITVSDTGEGIGAEFLPFVFDRFRQADGSNTRSHGGLGLGLAITRHLLELHGGTIMAESNGEGQGASFTIMLPLARQRPQERRKTKSLLIRASAAAKLTPTLDGLRVLVVEDEPDAQELCAEALAQHGAEVTVVSSAAKALDALQQLKIDVLVSDIQMPEMDGYELIGKVRALEADGTRRIPAIALTAYTRVEDRMKSLLAGYQAHFSKPFELTELVAMVASLAGRTGQT